MNRLAKTSLPILIVFIIIILAFGASGLYFFQKEKARGLALQEELNQAQAAQSQAEEKLISAKKLISGLESKLKEANGQIERLSSELGQEKTAKEETLTQLGQLKADLAQQKGLRSDLETKLAVAEQGAKKVQEELDGLAAKNNALELKLKELEPKSQSVELGTVVVNSETKQVPQKKEKPQKSLAKKKSAPVMKEKEKATKDKEKAVLLPAGLEGRVLVVNKDYNFAVISLGSNDGIGVGDVFSVYRDKDYLGDVKVEKVHESMAAAGFVLADLKDKVLEGDKVVQNLSSRR